MVFVVKNSKFYVICISWKHILVKWKAPITFKPFVYQSWMNECEILVKCYRVCFEVFVELNFIFCEDKNCNMQWMLWNFVVIRYSML